MSNQDIFSLTLGFVNFCLVMVVAYLGYRWGYKNGVLKGCETAETVAQNTPVKDYCATDSQLTNAEKWLKKGNLLEALRHFDDPVLLSKYNNTQKQFNLGLIDFDEHKRIMRLIKEKLERKINEA